MGSPDSLVHLDCLQKCNSMIIIQLTGSEQNQYVDGFGRASKVLQEVIRDNPDWWIEIARENIS